MGDGVSSFMVGQPAWCVHAKAVILTALKSAARKVGYGVTLLRYAVIAESRDASPIAVALRVTSQPCRFV